MLPKGRSATTPQESSLLRVLPLGSKPSVMDSGHRRRQELGAFASAALPTLWKALERKGWTHSDFARAAEISTAQAARILYGERGAGRRVATFCFTELGVKLFLWDKPITPNWNPHSPARARPRRDALPRTGTDD